MYTRTKMSDTHVYVRMEDKVGNEALYIWNCSMCNVPYKLMLLLLPCWLRHW